MGTLTFVSPSSATFLAVMPFVLMFMEVFSTAEVLDIK